MTTTLQEQIELLKSQFDLVDEVSKYSPLSSSDQVEFIGVCPFPSVAHHSRMVFRVTKERQLFHCNECGVGGDIIHFFMRMNSKNFADTITWMHDEVAARLGLH